MKCEEASRFSELLNREMRVRLYGHYALAFIF